jgi:hypothetical protein
VSASPLLVTNAGAAQRPMAAYRTLESLVKGARMASESG